MESVRDLVTIMPAGVPYLTYLKAVAADSHPPELDWETAYENWSDSHDGSIQPQLRKTMAAALSAFDACPEQSTANALYESLAAHRLELGGLMKSRTPSLNVELNLGDNTTQLLLEISTATPHRVAFVNTVAWLVALLRDLDPVLARAAVFDNVLKDVIWTVCNTSEPTGAINSLVASFARAGSFDARLWLCERLDDGSSHDLKSTALRFGFSSLTPQSAELYGEPNEKFAPALVDFIQQTDLHTELQADEIDDELCHAVLDILSEGLCTCIVDGVELSFFKQHIPIEEIIRLSIEHLQGRSLTLDELFDCAWIYHVVFEELDRWMAEDVDARFDENDLVINRNAHRNLAQSIRDLFTLAGNKETLQKALDAGGIEGATAQIAFDRINGTYSATTYLRRHDFLV